MWLVGDPIRPNTILVIWPFGGSFRFLMRFTVIRPLIGLPPSPPTVIASGKFRRLRF